MDVRFCEEQEPPAERHTCASAVLTEPTHALSAARTADSCFSLDNDLHGCRSFGQNGDHDCELARQNLNGITVL